VTLFILGIIGTVLLPYLSTPAPFVLLPLLLTIGAGFAWTTLRNDYVKGLVREGWTPLLAAVTISSATGMVLERCVGRYEGYAILAVSMTGLSGSVGSIHASRLSTILHQAHPPSPAQSALPSPSATAVSTPLHSRSPSSAHHHPHPHLDPPPEDVAAPRAIAVALFLIAIPVQIFFLLFVGVAGWMRVGEWQLVVSFVLVFGFTVSRHIFHVPRLLFSSN
jgi:solute carrier family 41